MGSAAGQSRTPKAWSGYRSVSVLPFSQIGQSQSLQYFFL
jgi:hypothetical protein